MEKNVDLAGQRARLRAFQEQEREATADAVRRYVAGAQTNPAVPYREYVARDVPSLPSYRATVETCADPWTIKPAPPPPPRANWLTVGEVAKIIWAGLLLWPLWALPLMIVAHLR